MFICFPKVQNIIIYNDNDRYDAICQAKLLWITRDIGNGNDNCLKAQLIRRSVHSGNNYFCSTY